MLTILCCALLSYVPKISAQEQGLKVTYAEDSSNFPNPERGWFWPENAICCGTDKPHPPLNSSDLLALRNKPEGITLFRDAMLLGQYMNSDLPQLALDNIEKDFTAARLAGVKLIPRIAYDWSIQNREPDENQIHRHLAQLAPIFQRNSDVIAWMDGGLIGGSGEANASDHGYVSNFHDGWQGLSDAGIRLYQDELKNLLPLERMMAVRYPRLKWDLLGLADDATSALSLDEAYSGSDKSRVGFTSDGYMGNSDHFAFFAWKHDIEKAYVAADAQYVVMEGEPSTTTPYNSTPGNVPAEMNKYHQTALNLYSDDALPFYQALKDNGDYDEVTKRMGYRFRLIDSTAPGTATAGSAIELLLTMTNDGWARAMNPRGVELVLRDASGNEYKIPFDAGKGNRLWFPGPGETKSLSLKVTLPALPAGDYDLFLSLPDPAPSIHDRPEYAIRLANTNVWEANTGYNRLQRSLSVPG